MVCLSLKIRGKLLNIKYRTKKFVFLVIDPFHRLGSGSEKIDISNETKKIDTVVSDIKRLAEDLEIHILALGDTVKNHKDNITGEGAGRASLI